MKSFKQLNESLKDTCWKGYEAIGTKKKNGKEVPNCVPVKEEESEAEKAKKELDLKLSKWKNQQRAAKALGEEVLDEGKMGQLHADIEDHLGKHVANYKKTGGSEHFAGKVEATTKHIAKLHNISHEAAQKHVNDYVDNNLKEEKKEDLPFTPDKPHKPVAKAGKFGLGYSVAKHLAKQGMKKVTKEEVEQIDEVSKDTLTSYVHKSFAAGNELHKQIEKETDPAKKAELKAKLSKRNTGVIKAAKKLREDVSMLSFDDYLKEDRLAEADVAAIRAQYKKNESDNRHTENAELLAKHFGSKSDQNKVAKAKAYRDRNNGYSSDAEGRHYSKLAHEVHSKLYHHIKEEVELDEATSPMQKLRDAHDRHMEKALAANKAGDDEATKVHQQYMQKITAKMNKLKQNEEIDLTEMEDLCEISKATLASYIPKAAQSARFSGMTAQDMANRSDRARNKSTKDSYHRLSMKYKNKAWDREDNIKKAAQKLAKEDVEQIDELDKKTLGSYAAKSHDQLMKHTSSVNFKQGRGDSDAFAYAHDKEAVRKTANRTKGLHTAINKLAKEEAEVSEEYHVVANKSYYGDKSTPVKLSSHKTKDEADAALAKHKANKSGRERWHKTVDDAGLKKHMNEEVEQIAEAYRLPSDSEMNKVKAHVKANHPNKSLAQVSVHKATKKIEYVVKDKQGKMSGHTLGEEAEQIDELSKDTLGNYIKRSSHDAALSARHGGSDPKELKNTIKRLKGIAKATNKLTKEETELSESAEDKAASEVHKNLLYGSVKHGAQDIPGHIKTVMKKHGATDYNKVVTAVRKKGYTGKIDETVEEAVNVDVTSAKQKMAKTGKMSLKDKILSIPRGFKAARAGKSEVDANLNKEETEMLTFKQLMQNISEAKIDDLKDRIAARKATQSAYDKDYKPEPKSSVVKVKGHSYGAGEEEGEDEDDNNKKVSKPAKPEVKRGRGRPAGSKSGARN